MVAVLVALVTGVGLAAPAAGSDGNSVIVVYNRRVPESRAIAEYYANKRQVPTNQVWGYDLPIAEEISRAEFQEKLQQPLFASLDTNHYFMTSPMVIPATRDRPGEAFRQVIAARIRYLVLCYGVPVRIAPDTNLVELGMDRVRVELRRNEAAVDSELSLLPLLERKPHLFGPLNNALYGTTNSADMNPGRGIMLVSRLDGPSPEKARHLVDLAMQAEADGLWGRAYFDSRGLTNGEYKLGDDWIREASLFARRMGFETVLDDRPSVFTAAFPLCQVALYAGWYEQDVAGAFALPKVEFMTGAVAYHLHSFSGHEIRNPTHYWVGPLIDKGATATMGCVYEPYLAGTPDVSVFFARFLRGFTFGEAAYACQSLLSWQTTVVGDPLYRPFAKDPQTQHQELVQSQSPLLEWSHLRAINLNLVTGTEPGKVIAYLERLPLRSQSALLEEKLAELYVGANRLRDAVDAYARALNLKPSPQQEVRICIESARFLQALGDEKKLYEFYQNFVAHHSDYPDLLVIYRKLYALAQARHLDADANAYQKEIEKRSPAAPLSPAETVRSSTN
jgi:uncharacterized protein (TIGR03790 family)